MPTVFVPVEVTDDQLASLGGKGVVSPLRGTSVPSTPPPPATTPAADPWTGAPVPTSASPVAPAAPSAPSAPAPTPSAPTPTAPTAPPAPAASGPTCAHGPMRYVPAGIAKGSGKAYSAFWGCSAPRDAASKCNSVPG